jgi:hypothetical protein
MRFDLLIMRALLLNVAGVCLLYWGLDTGVVQSVFTKDQTFISESIVGVFLFGWVLCLYRIWQVSDSINHAEDGAVTTKERFNIASEICVSPIARISSLLVAMGIIGTMYGIIVALSQADLTQLADVSTVGQELTVMVGGLMTMFVSTITGLVTSAYLGLNLQLLENGFRKLYIKANV